MTRWAISPEVATQNDGEVRSKDGLRVAVSDLGFTGRWRHYRLQKEDDDGK